MPNHENIEPKTNVKDLRVKNIWSVKMQTFTKKLRGMGFLTDCKPPFFLKKL